MQFSKHFVAELEENENNLNEYVSKLKRVELLCQTLSNAEMDEAHKAIIELKECIKCVCLIIKTLRTGFDLHQSEFNANSEFFVSELKSGLDEIQRGEDLIAGLDKVIGKFGTESPEIDSCHIKVKLLTEELIKFELTYRALIHKIELMFRQQRSKTEGQCNSPMYTKGQSAQTVCSQHVYTQSAAKYQAEQLDCAPVVGAATTGGLFWGLFARRPKKAKVNTADATASNSSNPPEIPDRDFSIPKRKDDVDALKISDVQFSAIVRKKAALSEYLPINIIMYEDGYRCVVDNNLDDTKNEARSGYYRVSKGAGIKVTVSSKDIAIDDCEEKSIWQGKFLEFGFVAKIPDTFNKKQILFCANVYIDDVIATRLKFVVDIADTKEQKIEIQREDVTTAFVSYASKDRYHVAAIIQGMQKARPDMDVFFDVETLRSGQKWQTALMEEIDKRAVFFLCWSKSASESKWVEFEWRYALDKKGEECIEPIPIEPPEFCPPPLELQQKHFNDKMAYVIKALEYMTQQ